MMIAMFTRSFDVVFDSLIEHVQTNYARVVLAWCASSPEPPPLNLLRLPLELTSAALSLLPSSFRRRRRPPPPRRYGESFSPGLKRRSTIILTPTSPSCSSTVLSELRLRAIGNSSLSPPGSTFSGLGLQGALDELLEREAARRGSDESEGGGGKEGEGGRISDEREGREGKDLADYSGITIKSGVGLRNSWEIWKEQDGQELEARIAQFITRQENSLVQEESWRLKLLHRVGDHVNELGNHFAEVQAEVGTRYTSIMEELGEMKRQQARDVKALEHQIARLAFRSDTEDLNHKQFASSL